MKQDNRGNRKLNEMWSFVEKNLIRDGCGTLPKRTSGKVLAYARGTRRDEVFVQLKALLLPYRIHRYTDNWGAYKRHLNPLKHQG